MDSEQSRARRPNRRRGAPGAADGSNATAGTRSADYRRLRNPFEPLKVLSEDEVAHIHDAALSILEKDGMRVLLPEARRHFAQAGAAIDEAEQMVRLDRGLVAQ